MTKYNVLQKISVLSDNSVLFWTSCVCRNTVYSHQLTKVGVLVLELLGAVGEHEVGVELPLVGELVVPLHGGTQLGAEHGDQVPVLEAGVLTTDLSCCHSVLLCVWCPLGLSSAPSGRSD